MADPTPAVLVCSTCRKDFLVTDYDPDKDYLCSECSSSLTTRTVVANAAGGAEPEEAVPQEVVEARNEPSRRLGNFTLVREVGRGGAGVVYKAWDEELSRWVAVKTLLPQAMTTEELARFRREGRMAARIEHPNILPVYDVKEIGGVRYIVMKFVDGTTLDKAGIRDVAELTRIVRDACRGVGHAHKSGLIHRDLKPQNVMIDRDGRAYVLDFGLAKSLDAKSATLTATQGFLGTPAYMSPEQARGLLHEVDTRTDVYSMGATLWFALTGRHPHTGRSAPEVIIKIATDPTPSVRDVRPDVPEALDAVLLKAMAKERADRFPTCGEFADALEGCLRGATPVPPPPPPRRSRKWIAVPIVALLAAAAGIGWWKWRPKPEPTPAPVDPGANAEPPREPTRWEEFRKVEAHAHRVQCLAVSADGARLASGAKDGTIKLWNSASGAEEGTIAGHAGGVWCVAFSPDGGLLASSGEDDLAKVWRIADRSLVHTLAKHEKSMLGVMAVAFHPDGRRLATGGYDRTIRLWKVETGEELSVLQGHGRGVMALAFSHDGKRLASGGDDMTVRLWDPETGAETSLLMGHQAAVWSVAFDRAGKTLASGGADNSVKVWNPATGKEVRAFAGHTGVVRRVAFHPERESVTSCADDATVRVWGLGSGREIRVLTGHESAIWSAVYAPDGKTLITAGADRTVRWWRPAR